MDSAMMAPPETTAKRRWQLIAIGLLMVYWAVSLDALDVVPAVGQDEPWVAAAPYKLATQGVLGSDLFTGYYGMERHHYQHPPLYPLLQAVVFRLAGVGVWQMRLLPVSFGLLVLALTYAVGKQLVGERVGTLAVLLLLGIRLAEGAANTGVPLLDLARVNRYDIAVPVFGLAALWVFNRAARQGTMAGVFLSGVLVGLAGLSHIYGLFWAPVLAVSVFWHERLRTQLWRVWAALAGGIVLMWLPWVVWVASGWADFLGQQRLVADRFELFNPRFFLENLRREPERYGSLQLVARGQLQLLRPGTWMTLLLLPPALALLIWNGARSNNRRSLTLAAAMLGLTLLFALLLRQKHYNYMIALWPLVTLALAWLLDYLWNHWRKPLLQLGMAALLIVVMMEGASRMAYRHQRVAHTTPYDQFEARVASLIPSGSVVLGLPHYWLGLRGYPYRTWLLPVALSDGRSNGHPMSIEQAIETVDPDVILIDRNMREFLDEASIPSSPYHGSSMGIRAFMARHDVQLVGAVDDPTYGKMEVYRVP